MLIQLLDAARKCTDNMRPEVFLSCRDKQHNSLCRTFASNVSILSLFICIWVSCFYLFLWLSLHAMRIIRRLKKCLYWDAEDTFTDVWVGCPWAGHRKPSLLSQQHCASFFFSYFLSYCKNLGEHMWIFSDMLHAEEYLFSFVKEAVVVMW